MIGMKLNNRSAIISTIACIFVLLGFIPYCISIFDVFIATLLFWIPFLGFVLSLYSVFVYRTKYSSIILCFCLVMLSLLFIIFGVAEDKMNIIIGTPIASAFWFFCVFFLIYIQVKNKNCPEGFLNFFEIFATLFFGIFSIAEAIYAVISGFQTFTPLMVPGLLTYASIAWAHSKREKL